jgi:CubicO group peptidase (beta-lactamase class C family)
MKNIGVYIISGVLTFLSLSSCSTDKTEEKHKIQVVKEDYTPEFNNVDASFIKETKKDIYPFYNEVLGNKRFNGMFLVAKNGKIIFEKVHGYLNYEEEEKLETTTPIHLASISKVATALATMRLVDQQKINLEDDIRKYLPTIPYKGITVRMLLNHRSGIPYYGYFSEGIWNKKFIMRNKDVLKMINKQKFPLNYPAGTHFAYCNTNYALLALIIEKASEKKFPIAMKELIFEPLKMENSFIMDKPEKINEVSPSYNSRYVMQAVDFLDGVYGDKNMYSTARDILKMDIATYSKDFLSEKARKEIYRGYSYERAGARNYGLGMRMVEVPDKKPYFFHTGWWHGNTGCYATLRGDTVCIVALSNAYTKSVYKIHKLANLFKGYPFEKEEE